MKNWEKTWQKTGDLLTRVLGRLGVARMEVMEPSFLRASTVAVALSSWKPTLWAFDRWFLLECFDRINH